MNSKFALFGALLSLAAVSACTDDEDQPADTVVVVDEPDAVPDADTVPAWKDNDNSETVEVNSNAE